MLLNSAQIDRIFDGFIRLANFSSNGTSNNITTALTSALSTAGNGGVNVPLQVATSSVVGVVTAVTVPLFETSTKKPFRDATGNEVYGKITEASGVYTLSYFSFISGTETAYNFAAATNIDFLAVYRFDFWRVPNNFAVAYPIGDINLPNVGNTSTNKWLAEKLTVTANNTINALTKTPTAATSVFLHVNGKTENAFGGASAAFSTSGKTITWSAVNSGYVLTTSMDVVAFYESAE